MEYRIVSEKKRLFGRLSVNTILILINSLMFIILSILTSINPNFINYFSLTPSRILHGQYLWTLLTSMFSHIYFWHIAFNMISLFFLGVIVEKIIGPKRYLLFYISAGLFAGIVFVLLAGYLGTSNIGTQLFGNPDISGLGASGAIFGLVGLLAILTPKKKVYLIVGPLLAIIAESVITNFVSSSISGIIDAIITIYVFFSIFAMFSFNPIIRKSVITLGMPFWLIPIIAIIPLFIVGLFVPLPIANSAHLGGLIFGLAFGIYLKVKYKRKTKYISKYFA